MRTTIVFLHQEKQQIKLNSQPFEVQCFFAYLVSKYSFEAHHLRNAWSFEAFHGFLKGLVNLIQTVQYIIFVCCAFDELISLYNRIIIEYGEI